MSDDHGIQRGDLKGRRRVGVGLIVAVALLAGWVALQLWQPASGSASSLVTWRSDYDAALAEAERRGQPVLLKFTADWCPPCQWMNRHVYSERRVARAIERRFMPVEVDLTERGRQERAFASKWGVRGIPTLIMLDREGESIARRVGRVRQAALMDWFEQGPAATQPATAAQTGSPRAAAR